MAERRPDDRVRHGDGRAVLQLAREQLRALEAMPVPQRRHLQNVLTNPYVVVEGRRDEDAVGGAARQQ